MIKNNIWLALRQGCKLQGMQQRHYLYNSCSELMQEIQHSFYPRHSLKLLVAEEPKSQCVARWFFIKGLKYICDKRSFHLHPKCISLKANIKNKDHERLLILVENMCCEGDYCEACNNRVLVQSFTQFSCTLWPSPTIINYFAQKTQLSSHSED